MRGGQVVMRTRRAVRRKVAGARDEQPHDIYIYIFGGQRGGKGSLYFPPSYVSRALFLSNERHHFFTRSALRAVHHNTIYFRAYLQRGWGVYLVSTVQ